MCKTEELISGMFCENINKKNLFINFRDILENVYILPAISTTPCTALQCLPDYGDDTYYDDVVRMEEEELPSYFQAVKNGNRNNWASLNTNF